MHAFLFKVLLVYSGKTFLYKCLCHYYRALEEISTKVERLLVEDRYICREKEREVSTWSSNNELANGH